MMGLRQGDWVQSLRKESTAFKDRLAQVVGFCDETRMIKVMYYDVPSGTRTEKVLRRFAPTDLRNVGSSGRDGGVGGKGVAGAPQ